MTIKELLIKEIESSSDTLIRETLDFLLFIKSKPTEDEVVVTYPIHQYETSGNEEKPKVQEAKPLLRGSKAEDLVKFAGTWQGDDFEECLQLVYDTRSQAEF